MIKQFIPYTKVPDKLQAYFSQFKTDRLGLVYTPYVDPIAVYDMVRAQSGNKYRELLAYEHDFWLRKYGPQGGYPSARQADNAYRVYYGYTPERVEPADDGIQILLNMFKSRGIYEGSIEPMNPYKAVINAMKNSNSGPVYFGKRNDFDIVARTISDYHQNKEFAAVLQMFRYAKMKLRPIFNDDMKNYMIEAPYVAPLYDLFKEHIVPTMMLNGRYRFQNYLANHNILTNNTIVIEGDAKAMDTKVTLHQVRKYVEPVMIYLYGHKHADRIRAFHDELFSTDLILPTGKVITGQHSLFSGILPTNIYESIIMLVGNLEVYSNTYWVTGEPLYDDFNIFNMGDDIIVFLNGKTANRYAQTIRKDPEAKVVIYNDQLMSLAELQTEILERMGLEAELHKQRVAVGNGFFCSRFYSPSLVSYSMENSMTGRHSARSIIATMNSINNPEHGRNTGSDELIRIFGILDDAFGTPLWLQFTQMLFKSIRSEFHMVVITDEEINRYNRSRNKKYDWVLEGWNWEISTSPAFHVWKHGNLNGFQLPRQYTSSF